MRILAAEPLERFVGPADQPLQVVRILVKGTGTAAVHVEGHGLRTPAPARSTLEGWDHPAELELPVEASGLAVGQRVPAEVVLTPTDEPPSRFAFGFVIAEPGWRMFMVSHFHYDPVWWNTQASYTETWEKRPREERPWEGRKQQPAFTLIEAHLDVARRDPDYRFVLAELDYLKPYWDTFPWRRDELRQLLRDGRLELMGGTYNEPNTNLTSAESTARNAVYGIGYQRHVLGGDPATAWQLDVFGHDPQFPGMMADAGLTSSSWARGPFHQWGPSRSPGGNPAMQFASEFEWLSPSGRGLLTSYMANHYSAGWELDDAADLDEAVAQAERLFHELKAVAATRNVLLPVGSDYTPPNRWMAAIARWWNARYTWPRFQVGLPREFFAAVRDELRSTGARLTPQTRDMNPVYSGKDVSYIDTKQAQRAGESTLLAAERFGTVAALLGARYPAEALDKAWRQLLFGAHHDGITGTESDQVYLDLLGGWRDTYELASEALDDALAHLGRQLAPGGPGATVAVFNALSWERTDVGRCRVELDEPADGVRLLDEDGDCVPFVVEAAERDQHGRLRAVTLVFLAQDVPSLGYRTYRAVAADDLPPDAAWRARAGATAANERYEVSVDQRRGGAISSWINRASGEQLLAPDGLANEVLAYREYPTHPSHGEGPWHLTPDGRHVASSERPADEVRVERSALGERLVVRGGVDGCSLVQTTTLYRGLERVVCTTDLDGFEGRDTLFRLRVAADVPGGLPISEVGHAVVGRGAGFPDVDVAEVSSTLDNPANTWFAVGATARLDLASSHDGPVTASRAISVAELVAPDEATVTVPLRALAVALVRSGVTSTVSRGGGPRYGSIDTDSNLPDVRIAIGGPDENAFTRAVLDTAGAGYRVELQRQLDATDVATVYVPARSPLSDRWRPNADLRGPRDLPVLIVAGRDPTATARILRAVGDGFERSSRYVVAQDAQLHLDEGHAPERTVAILNAGLPGFNVDIHGRLHLSLLRSCSGWPSGVWLDPPRRTAPDGSSFQFEHWTHRFAYALVGGTGDWRALRLVHAGHEHNEPLRARQVHDRAGHLPPSAAFLRVEGDGAVLSALKPAGNPMAEMAGSEMDPADGITARWYEAYGRAATGRVRLFRPVRAASRADLLERPVGPLPVDDDGVAFGLDAYGIATLRLQPDVPSHAGTRAALGRRREPAQPVFGDYWLHNKGAAPIGYQPVTARIVERAVAGDGPFLLRVAVATQRTDVPVAGSIDFDVPPGWRAEPGRVTYTLAPGAHELLDAEIVPAADAAAGRWFVAVRLDDAHGQVHEDVVTVDLGRASPGAVGEGADRRVLHLERATRKAAVVDVAHDPAEVAALGGELTAALPAAHLSVSPGGCERLTVRLDNHVAGAIRGEAQLISPWGTWHATTPWTRGFTVDGHASADVGFAVSCPPGTPPTLSWALVKVMYFGRLLYTPSIHLRLGDPGVAPT